MTTAEHNKALVEDIYREQLRGWNDLFDLMDAKLADLDRRLCLQLAGDGEPPTGPTLH